MKRLGIIAALSAFAGNLGAVSAAEPPRQLRIDLPFFASINSRGRIPRRS